MLLKQFKKNIRTIKYTLMYLVFLLLNACAESQYANIKMNPIEINNNKMGMIVTKISVPYRDLFDGAGHYDGYLHLVYSKNNDKNKAYFVDGSSYLNASTMIKPGIYHIDTIGWSDGMYKYQIKAPYNKLEVKPGACVYIGDIFIIRKKDGGYILVKNNLSEAISKINNDKLSVLAKRLYFVSLIKNEVTYTIK